MRDQVIRYEVTLMRSVQQYRTIVIEASSPIVARRRALAFVRSEDSGEACDHQPREDELGDWLSWKFSAAQVHEVDVAGAPKEETG